MSNKNLIIPSPVSKWEEYLPKISSYSVCVCMNMGADYAVFSFEETMSVLKINFNPNLKYPTLKLRRVNSAPSQIKLYFDGYTPISQGQARYVKSKKRHEPSLIIIEKSQLSELMIKMRDLVARGVSPSKLKSGFAKTKKELKQEQEEQNFWNNF